MRSNPIFVCLCVNPSLKFLEIIEFPLPSLSFTMKLTKNNQMLLFNPRWQAQNTNHAHKYTSQGLYFLIALKTSFTAEGFKRFAITYSNIRSSWCAAFPKWGPETLRGHCRGKSSHRREMCPNSTQQTGSEHVHTLKVKKKHSAWAQKKCFFTLSWFTLSSHAQCNAQSKIKSHLRGSETTPGRSKAEK